MQVWAFGLFIGQNLPAQVADGVFHGGLLLPGLVQRVMLAVVGDTPLIVLGKLLQLSLGVLRRVHAQNNWAGRMAAVQVPDTPLQAVVQLLILRITVLAALDRLMVWRAGRVGADLPAVTPQPVMVGFLDFIVQRAKLVHDVPPAGVLNADAPAGFLLYGAQAALGQRHHGTADRRFHVQHARRRLPEGKIQRPGVCILQRKHLAVRCRSPQVLQHLSRFALGHLGIGVGHLLQAAVILIRQAFVQDILKQAADNFLLQLQLLRDPPFDLFFAGAQCLGAVDLIFSGLGDGAGALDTAADVFDQVVDHGLGQGENGVLQPVALGAGHWYPPPLHG